MRTARRLAVILLAASWVPFASATAAPPGPFTSLTMQKQEPEVGWSPVPDAQTYDVVAGDLGVLHYANGSFTASVLMCVASNTAETSVDFARTPSPGYGYWILVRGDNTEGSGTYDSGAASQAASRDAGIDASPNSCGYPAVCGDGACTSLETCVSCPTDCGACPCTVDSECQPASCCNPTSCITIWEPQSCDPGGCSDGCSYCLTGCVCDAGQCTAVF